MLFNQFLLNFSQFHENFLDIFKTMYYLHNCSICTCKGFELPKLNTLSNMHLIFFLLTRYFWDTLFDVKKIEIACLCYFYELSVFPNTSCRICLMMLKTCLLYHLNNTFRKNVSEMSFPNSLTTFIFWFSTFFLINEMFSKNSKPL